MTKMQKGKIIFSLLWMGFSHDFFLKMFAFDM